MNAMKRDNTVSYFADRIACCKKQAQELTCDDRGDEAVFAKVRMNVYDIFSTIFSVAVKTAGEDDEKLMQFFAQKIRQIPQSWHASLANALQHGDSDKAYLEQIKLEAVEEIKKEVARIWEVTL